MYKFALMMMVLAALVVGCKNKSNPAPAQGSLTDITPAQPQTPTNPPVTVTPTTPTVAPVDQPLADPGPSAPGAGAKKYVVKKNDTLWSIAKTTYGDGKQYTRIVAANPGVTPQTLKVGQTLTLP